MNTIRELKQQEKYKTMLKRKNKEKKIYKDKNASLQFEKQKLYRALLNREREIERLNNIINELEKDIDNFDVFKQFSFPLMKRWEEEQVKSSIDYEWRKAIKEPFLNKIKELKGSNEPSFEEMVGFVENVCKDIKSQPTLHEELEEERKKIAKIVSNFKEVNK